MSRRWLGALALVLALGTIVPAQADEPVASGWWYRLQSGLSPVAIPPPPDAPPDGLYVALDPSGPLAIAAVSYAGSADSQGGTLTLTFEGPPKGVPTLDACVATAAVSGAYAGAWETQPSHDCEAGRAEGAIAADGATITFTLTPEFVSAAETVDAVIVPTGSAPFSAPIAKPDVSSFAPAAPLAPEGDSGFTPDDGSFGGDAGAPLGDDGSFGSGDPLTPGDAFGGDSTPLPGAPTDDGSTDAGGAGGGSGGETPVAGGPIADEEPVDQVPKLVAVALLGALGAAYWYLSNRSEPAPRLIGGLTARRGAEGAAADEVVAVAMPVAGVEATRAAHPIGGLGRFARPREKLPNRL